MSPIQILMKLHNYIAQSRKLYKNLTLNLKHYLHFLFKRNAMLLHLTFVPYYSSLDNIRDIENFVTWGLRSNLLLGQLIAILLYISETTDYIIIKRN